MFGSNATTAWELEAERRVELAQRARQARDAKRQARDLRTGSVRESGLLASLLRWAGSLREAPSAGLKDVRT